VHDYRFALSSNTLQALFMCAVRVCVCVFYLFIYFFKSGNSKELKVSDVVRRSPPSK